MMLAGGLGAVLGAGLWLIARGLTATPRPLRTLSSELMAPRPEVAHADLAAPGSSVRSRWVTIADRLSAPASPRLAADLAVLQRTLARHTLDRLGYATLFAAFVGVAVAALPLAGVAVPVLPAVDSVALALVVGWPYPAVEVRSRAVHARRSWAQTLTVFVDIAGISLAGGAGVEEALMTAAGAGVGPQFQELSETLHTAQTRRQPLWTAMEELGVQDDIPLLRELAASVELAAESGTRIRETLIAKAGAMRIRQLTDVEAEAQRASETMGVAPALMAVAAIVLIGYPALARFFEG